MERTVNYLRLSVTDLCNYRCRYCMGEDGVEKKPHRDILSIEELAEIGRAAVACGIEKIRLTGGEPLVRRGIVSLCRQLRALQGLRELTLTTNGSLLPEFAAELKAAGVDRLNVSLDTLDPEKFAHITRCGTLEQVFRGLDAAKRAGFQHTKLNTVLMGGFNIDEIPALVELTRENDYSLRFIELMPMGQCADWNNYVGAEAVLRAVPQLTLLGGDGVAQLYRVPGYCGTVGLIRPISQCFCDRCNRIRVTADGKLKPCLHSERERSLRGLRGAALEEAIRAGIAEKPERHHLTVGRESDAGRQMNEIGG